MGCKHKRQPFSATLNMLTAMTQSRKFAIKEEVVAASTTYNQREAKFAQKLPTGSLRISETEGTPRLAEGRLYKHRATCSRGGGYGHSKQGTKHKIQPGLMSYCLSGAACVPKPRRSLLMTSHAVGAVPRRHLFAARRSAGTLVVSPVSAYSARLVQKTSPSRGEAVSSRLSMRTEFGVLSLSHPLPPEGVGAPHWAEREARSCGGEGCSSVLAVRA